MKCFVSHWLESITLIFLTKINVSYFFAQDTNTFCLCHAARFAWIGVLANSYELFCLQWARVKLRMQPWAHHLSCERLLKSKERNSRTKKKSKENKKSWYQNAGCQPLVLFNHLQSLLMVIWFLPVFLDLSKLCFCFCSFHQIAPVNCMVKIWFPGLLEGLVIFVW